MAFAKQSMIWKDFYGGISQDDYLTTGKQVLYAENVDLTSSSDYVQLGKNSKERYTTTSDVLGFIEAKSGTLKKIFAYTDDGKIYDTTDGTVESTAIGDDIVNAIRFNDYIYFISNDSTYPIRRIPESDAYSNTWGTLTNITALAFDASGADIYPVLSYLDEYFFLGVGNTVYKIDAANTFETFDIFDGTVVGLSNIGGVIKVFTDKGKICFWDGLSVAVDSVLDIHETIRGIINQGKIDYIIAGHSDFQAKIKVLNGYTIQKLSNARYSDVFGNYIGKVEYLTTNQVAKIGETIYFAQDGFENKDVLRYGTNNPVLSAGFNISNGTDTNGDSIQNIRALYGTELTTNDALYIGMRSNSQEAFEVININDGNYKDEGYLITNPFDGGSKSQKKKIEELIIVTSNCDASETVELQVSIDGGAFSTIQTVNSGITLTRTEIFDHVDDFIDIKFKVILSSNGSTSTAKLHEIGLTYTVIE